MVRKPHQRFIQGCQIFTGKIVGHVWKSSLAVKNVCSVLWLIFARIWIPNVLGRFMGNAMLVADGIYQACRFWELFQDTDLKGHCAVVTSYEANASDIKDEARAGDTEER